MALGARGNRPSLLPVDESEDLLVGLGEFSEGLAQWLDVDHLDLTAHGL